MSDLISIDYTHHESLTTDLTRRQDAIEACLAKAKRQHGVLYAEDIDNIIDSLPSASAISEAWEEAMSMAIKALNSATDSENDTVESKNDVIKNLNDTISRQDAIDAVENNACNTQRIFDAINSLPSASVEVGEWIPCSERLPKEYAQYLVCFETGHCYVYWLKDSDWARGMVEKEGIIAWMPLPKPYEGSDDE